MDLLHAHWHYFVLELKFTKCQIFITASAFSFSAREENIRNQKPSRTHFGAWKAQEETKQIKTQLRQRVGWHLLTEWKAHVQRGSSTTWIWELQ